MTEAGEVLIPRQEAPRNTEGELPESKIFDLLSSVGNGEHHAGNLIVMKEGFIYSRPAFWHEIIDHQEEDGGWRVGRSVPFRHCEESLSPIGLVTREALSPDGTAWGYQITDYGLRTGVPFAGLLLKWSYEHPEYSLYKMFGSTNSTSIKDQQTFGKKRAQETRYKIFWEIATTPNNIVRQTDIAEGINENSQITAGHLESLKKSGVIIHESTQLGKSFTYFRRKEVIPDEEPKQYGEYKTLSIRVYDLLTYFMQQRPNEYLSLEEITNFLIQKYPHYETLHKESLKKKVSRLLSNFERQGNIERKKFTQDFRTEITLSDEQREAIVSLVTLIDKFKNGNRQAVDEGRKFAQKVASDPNLFSHFMLKAKEASPNANQTNKEDMNFYLISVLQFTPSTIYQIMQKIEENYDKRLTREGIRVHLSDLVREKKITFEKTKSGNVYRVVEAENNH